MSEIQRLTPEEEVRRARDAQQLLETPLLSDTIAAMKLFEQARWWRTEDGDIETREAAWRMLRTIDDFERTLTSLVTSGKLVEEKLRADELPTDKQQGFTSPNERRSRL